MENLNDRKTFSAPSLCLLLGRVVEANKMDGPVPNSSHWQSLPFFMVFGCCPIIKGMSHTASSSLPPSPHSVNLGNQKGTGSPIHKDAN